MPFVVTRLLVVLEHTVLQDNTVEFVIPFLELYDEALLVEYEDTTKS